MFGISRRSASPRLRPHRLGEVLLNLGFPRVRMRRMPRIEELPDHLRRDVGLPPRAERMDLRR